MADLAERYARVRAFSESVAEPLAVEDMVVQSMTEASPIRWHLAHTTWFFETFVLERWQQDFEPFDAQFRYLFNSYYQGVGPQFPRGQRGLLSRPTVAEVRRYRASVDSRMSTLLGRGGLAELDELARVVELGLNHEQQHQELMYTDIKHAFSRNPVRPAYTATPDPAAIEPAPLRWVGFPEGLRKIGHEGTGFAFDNELPRHRAFVPAFELASRPVTNAEYREFVDSGAYRRPELWLSDGWDAIREQRLAGPIYWERCDDAWWQFTMSGMQPLADADPVCHLSYYEADAYATWAGARLPAEAEWETAADAQPVAGNFATGAAPRPRAQPVGGGAPAQLFGDVWEWTSSAYAPYPGYAPPAGALGEYNGKFMCNQLVLRGGSCATPAGHVRPSYRNFFQPDARWQFTGIRLARDAD